MAEAGFADLRPGARFDVLSGADGEEQARPFGPTGLTFLVGKP